MNSNSAGAPPFFWKAPAQEKEKDHMSENYRRMKQIAAEGQKKRHGALKAKFIPGLTKNERYAHVQSKVGALLKSQGQGQGQGHLPAGKSASDVYNYSSNSGRGPATASAPPIHSRLSRSSVDLRQTNGLTHGSRAGSYSALQSSPSVTMLARNPVEESVYKWKLSEEVGLGPGPGPQANGYGSQLSIPGTVNGDACQGHRVEYLPCDGICRDEILQERGGSSPNSARSTGSRASRGCNTEETRIFPEMQMKMHQHQHQQQQQTLSQISGFGMPSEGNGQGDGGISEQMRQLHMKGVPQPKPIASLTRKGGKQESGSQSQQVIHNGNGSGDALPHTLGTVPKYLRQRQQEWREEEVARKEAEEHARIPQGYMLMSEEERIETLRQFQKNYDMLVAELNRIPITIDTVRVRNHKTELERQLQKLEDAMRTFSRPKVWVKSE